MRAYLFNAVATNVAIGAQRPVVRPVQFSGFDDEREVDQVTAEQRLKEEEAARKKLEDEARQAAHTHELAEK